MTEEEPTRWRIDRAYEKVYLLSDDNLAYEFFATFIALGVTKDNTDQEIIANATWQLKENKLWLY